MLIIVEGVDGSGKTTLVRRIKEMYKGDRPLWIMNNASRYRFDDVTGLDTFLTWIEQRNRFTKGVEEIDLLFDRFPFISELVYGKVLRGLEPEQYLSVPFLIEALRRVAGPSGLCIVYCRPTTSVIHQCIHQHAQMSGVVPHLDDLIYAYDHLMGQIGYGIPVIEYDRENTTEFDLFENILKHFNRTY